MIPTLVRSDARRPASWIAALGAAVVTAMPGGGPLATAAAGGLLAVAAVGDLLAGPARDAAPVSKILARGLWPLAGLVAGSVAGAAVSSGTRAVILAGGVLAMLAGILAAATRSAWPAWIRRAWPAQSWGGDRGEPWTDRIAMASMLAAMAVCYFLAPELSGWYAAIAAGWFALVAVPRATLWGDDAAARHRLIASAAGRPRPPGTAAHAARSLLGSTCLLGWPAIVAVALRREPGWAATGPVAAIAMLAGLAAVASVAAAAAGWRRWAADTSLAVTAASLAAGAAWIAQVP